MRPILLDANSILRYLLNDIDEQAAARARAVEVGAEVRMEVIAECVYVLDGVYQVPRGKISSALGGLLDEIDCERELIARGALRFYAERRLDFVDCVLLSEAVIGRRDALTFDRKLKRSIDELAGGR